MTIHKACLITGQEQHRLRLLNRLTKPTRGKVNLPTQTLGLVITQPVLQQRRVERRRAQAVEAESFARMHHGQFSGERQHGALGGRVGELRGGRSDERDDAGGVDDAALCLFVLAEGEHGVLGAEPDALDVDVHGEVPNGLGGADGVVVLGVHDACIVEDDVQTAGGVEGFDHGLDLGLFGDVAEGGGGGGGRDELFYFGEGLFEGGGGDVGHDDVGAFTGEEDGGFEADATERKEEKERSVGEKVFEGVRRTHPAAPVTMAFFPARRPTIMMMCCGGVV